MEGTRKRPCSDLPLELLSMIGSRLHTRMDVLRFRSVCSSFRSLIPLPRPNALRFSSRIPCSPGPDLFLHESTVYTLETPVDGAASGPARSLVKLGNMRILSLFSRLPIASLPHEFPEVLDSLQFRIVQICREYTLEYGGGTGGLVQGMLRVVVHPDCVWTDQNKCLVYFIDRERQLCYWKYGDENWSHLGWGYEDMVVYQGKVCVVDMSGLVSQIDSSFGLQSFSPPFESGHHGHRHWKRLVVSSGDLYAVDRCFSLVGMRTCDIRAYRLDQQCGRWEEVRSLGKSAFFLCNLCSFAVPECEFDWCKGDCIYYAENSFSYFSKEEVRAFSLADRRNESVEFSGLFR